MEWWRWTRVGLAYSAGEAWGRWLEERKKRKKEQEFARWKEEREERVKTKAKWDVWAGRQREAAAEWEIVHLLPGTYLLIVDRQVMPLEVLENLQKVARRRQVDLIFARVSDVEKVKVVRLEQK
jgi:uncharacterized cupin superfamily protein